MAVIEASNIVNNNNHIAFCTDVLLYKDTLIQIFHRAKFHINDLYRLSGTCCELDLQDYCTLVSAKTKVRAESTHDQDHLSMCTDIVCGFGYIKQSI